MNISGFWQRAIRFALIFQLAFPASLVPARAEGAAPPLIPAPASSEPPVSPVLAEAFADPIVESVASLGKLPNTVPVSARDAVVDADPYFLRAQRWEETAAPAGRDGTSDVAFASAADHFEIALGGASATWRVDAPLHPIYFDGERLFLSPNTADFYARSPGGEGIFVVLRDELADAVAGRARVPIYFLPLPDDGWWGNVRALAFPELGKVVLTDNHGAPLPVEDRDIDEALAATKGILSLAMAAGIRAASLTGAVGQSGIFPPRGSTAGFGMLFTGYDWDHPELSLFQSERFSWRDPFGKVRGFAGDALRRLGDWAIPSARAGELFSSPELWRSLFWIGSVTGTTLIASFALKLSLYRQWFAEWRARQPLEAPASTRAGRTWQKVTGGWLGRHSGEVGHVFAHSMSVLYFFPKVWFGKGLQFGLDTYFPYLNSSRNSLTRKFLDWSVYYTSSVSERVPVSLRTLMQQVLILGGINSTSYVAQLYFAAPWMEHHLAEAVPGLQSRVETALSESNHSIANFRHNELIREITSQLTNPNFAGYLKDYYTNVVLSEVDSILRERNLGPGDAKYQETRAKLIEEKVDQKLQQFGLPSNRDFLFDAATLWSFVTGRVLGFSPGKGAAAEHFLGAERPGLLAPAVRAALVEAKRRAAQYPTDNAFASAVKLLEEASGELSLLTAFAKYPFKVVSEIGRGRAPPGLTSVARSVRRLRQLLVALTYEGPIGTGIRDLPSPWVQAVGEPGARVAGELFRRAFLGFTTGSRDATAAPNASERQSVGDRQAEIESEALGQLEARYAEEFTRLVAKLRDPSAARKALAEAHPAELRYLQDAGWRQALTDKLDAGNPFSPPRWGWYRRRQEGRAKRIAHARFQTETGHPFNPASNDPDELTHYNRIYAEAMMRQAALYPDYEAAPGLKERVEWQASHEIGVALADRKAKAYLDSLTAEARVDFVATLYAESVTRNYVELTANSDAVPAHSPAQPGRFQWLRQTQLVRNSRFLTRTLRGLEAFFPVEAHQAGFFSRLFRGVPGLYDLTISSYSNYRNAVTGLLAVVPYRMLLWGASPSAHTWVLGLLSAPLGLAPAAILNRFCRMQGWQPMKGFWSLVTYASVFAWVNWLDVIPNMILERDFRHFAEAVQHGASAVAAPVHSCLLRFGLLGN